LGKSGFLIHSSSKINIEQLQGRPFDFDEVSGGEIPGKSIMKESLLANESLVCSSQLFLFIFSRWLDPIVRQALLLIRQIMPLD
jgi:hypothetical protein